MGMMLIYTDNLLEWGICADEPHNRMDEHESQTIFPCIKIRYIYIYIYDIPIVHGLGMYGNMIELNDWSLLESQ